MKTRMLSLLLIVGLLFAAVPAVFAQGADLTCTGLSDSDCALLTEATANSATIQSAFIDFSADMTLRNIAAVAMMMGGSTDEAPGDIVVNMTAEGPYVLDMTIMPPARVQMTVNASMDDGTTTENGSLNLVIADGIIYISEDGGATWEGMSYEDTLETMDPDSRAIVEGLMGGDMSTLPEGALSPGDLATGSPFAVLEELGLSEADIMALGAVPGFVTQARQPDEQLLGQTVAVFKTTIDLVPLFASEEFAKVLDGVMTVAAAEDPDAAQMGAMVPMLLSGIDVKIMQTQYIGTQDKLIRGMAMDLLLTFDLAALMGGAQEGQQLPPIELTLHFDASLDRVNETFEIIAPAGAVMVSPEDM
jgi:hypothetical protein